MRRILLNSALALGLAACGNPTPEPEPDPDPSESLCDPITTERECFDAGCSFFASAYPMTADSDLCDSGSAFGVCVYSQDPDGPPTLTFYTQERDGELVAFQLGFDVTLEGWTSCAASSLEETCACAE